MKIVFIICTAFLFVAAFVAASPVKHRDKCRDRAINETLQMTLLVGAEMREQGKKPTWEEIQSAVRKRLGVK